LQIPVADTLQIKYLQRII